MDEKNSLPEKERALPRQQTFPELWDLKEMREARGISLKDLFEKTRISQNNLVAVETGDFKRLPPPVYARNFIRKYARAIGIDEEPVLERYERYIASLEPPQEETEVRKPWPETGLRHRFLIRGLVGVIAAGLLVFAVFLYDQGDKPSSPGPGEESASPAQAVPPAPGQTADAVQNEPVQTGMVDEAPSPAATVPNVGLTASKSASSPAAASEEMGLPPATPGKTKHLVIEARELTWIRITEDRNPAYQVLLQPGEKIERSASDYFKLDIGNAGGIDLYFQEKSLGSIGRSGQVVHLRLPEKDEGQSLP